MPAQSSLQPAISRRVLNSGGFAGLCFYWRVPPCVLFEDEHLLVVDKPAGMNTHAPSPYGSEGIYDWLRHREPRWASLAIIHRLDKETSGVLVFSKTTLANRSLTAQFTARAVHKKYLLLTDRSPAKPELLVRSYLKRLGEKYVSTGPGSGGEPAETRFKVLPGGAPPGCVLIEAEPFTGRTHQIRVQAAENRFPILGDTQYGGTPAPRVCLHALEISFKHPASGATVRFKAPAEFAGKPRLALRDAVLDRRHTNAFRLLHGASDGRPGWHVDRLGEWLLSQTEGDLSEAHLAELSETTNSLGLRGAYHKRLTRHVRQTSAGEVCPDLIQGIAAPERFTVIENGIRYELSFTEGYSVGLFLDQRDNRRRLLTGHIAGDFELLRTKPLVDRQNSIPSVLNTFAYTCAFSVCAAKAGARITSVDLSKKYLEWGKRNFRLNGLDPAAHDFIYGDAFDWLKRLGKKGRVFDVVLLDPPTFSQSKGHGLFRAEKDYGKLVCAALPLLKRDGVLFASTNAAQWSAEDFLKVVRGAIQKSGRKLAAEHYVPQPPDFPVSRAEPAYLKTAWFRIG